MVVQKGWTIDTALVGFAGTGFTFGLWWIYYLVPSAPILHTHRDRAFVWGCGQIAIVTSIVATGAGLHVAAYFTGHGARIGLPATAPTVAVPVGVFLVVTYALHYYLVRRWGDFDLWLLIASTVLVGAAVVAAGLGFSLAGCLLILALAPTATVVGYEIHGFRRQTEALTEWKSP